MLPWFERHKTLAGAGIIIAAAATWVLAFRESSNDSDWNGSAWPSAAEIRGKAVPIGSRDVETTAERERRLAISNKALRQDIGNMKKNVLGDDRKIRGNDILPESAEIPPGYDVNPRDTCLQMKLEYPDKFGDVDCMSDKYDNPDPWYKAKLPWQK